VFLCAIAYATVGCLKVKQYLFLSYFLFYRREKSRLVRSPFSLSLCMAVSWHTSFWTTWLIFMNLGMEGEPNAIFFSFLQIVLTIWQICKLLKQVPRSVLKWCRIIDLVKICKFLDNNCVKCRITKWLLYKFFSLCFGGHTYWTICGRQGRFGMNIGDELIQMWCLHDTLRLYVTFKVWCTESVHK
jgi:hypothetical protein